VKKYLDEYVDREIRMLLGQVMRIEWMQRGR
jgi:hypothetical protein